MRWSTNPPWIHHIPILQRGIFLHTDIKICFTVFDDNQQEEAGDTTIHTFIKEPWPVCETRWFYFHGTIAGQPTPSTSAIFKKHRAQPPTTTTFYPDSDPELTCCDGAAERWAPWPGETWAQLHTRPGTWGTAEATTQSVSLNSGLSTNIWRYLQRSFLLFDTSIIPPPATILDAKLRLYGYTKSDTDPWAQSAASIVPSSPAINTDITAPDYQNIANTLLSDTKILWSAWLLDDWNEFPLNAAGLAAIAKGGITKLGVRLYPWDTLNVEPSWLSGDAVSIVWRSADHTPPVKPELIVTYQP